MVAGTPYIVYPQADIVNPVFEDVTISNSLLSVTKGDASFIGTISPVTLYDGAKTNLFLSNNMLYYPSGADVTVGPFRAYFTLSSPVPALAKVMIDFGDDDIEVTGIMVVDSGQLTVDSWYTMSGVRLQDKPTEKGIYIVNGKKVAIK